MSWLNDVRYTSKLIFELYGSPFVILPEGFHEPFLNAPKQPCNANERYQLYKKFDENINKMVQKLYVLDEGHKIYQYEYLSLTAALLSSFLKGFRESFLTAPILLALAQKV